MERSTENSNSLEWENYGLFGGKPIEILGQLGFSNYDLGIGSSSSSSKNNPFSCSPTREETDCFRRLSSLSPYENTYGNGNSNSISTSTIFSSGSNEPMVGLRLGRQKDCGDSFPSTKTSLPISSTALKRTRTSYQNMQNPCCQVEGCNLDLRSAKDYHRRHRICESHSKSPKVIVGGMERRFCQQCSRFHDLSEFDDKKRSCRRRLSDHNARRRRVPPETLQPCPAGLASAVYDRRQQNVFLNGLPISFPNSTWDNMLRQDSLTMPSNPELERSFCFSGNEIPSSISSLNVDSGRVASIQNSSPRILDQCLNIPTSGSPVAPDLHITHSLLSPNSWSLNEAEPTSTDCQFMHGNEIWGRFQSSNVIPAEQGPPLSLMHSINMHHNAGPPQLQEFQLFKASYESSCFYSGQRN